MDPSSLHCFLLLLGVVTFADAGSIGVNYGRIANNLPSAVKVVSLVKSQGLERVKVYDTDPAVLKALSGSGVKVTVDLPNELLYSAAKYPAFARSWVQKNIVAYHPSTQIEAIAVGNEVFVDPHNTTKFLIPAMKNIHQALVKFNLDSSIKVSSPIALSALQSSYPSSAGSFRPELIEPVFKPMLDFLRQTGSYLMVNAYPFFAYESNSDVISLDYALFRENPGVVDSGNGLRYHNLFDAQIDAVFAALSTLKYDDVKMVVTETGWPSKGDENEVGASVENAAAYNGNLIRRILTGGGTPLRPQADLTVFLFALFNENEKDGPTSERNYGLFYPDQQKVYDIPFTVEGLKNTRPMTCHRSLAVNRLLLRFVEVCPRVQQGTRGASRTLMREKRGYRRLWTLLVAREVLIAVLSSLKPRVIIRIPCRPTLRSPSTVIIRRKDVVWGTVILEAQLMLSLKNPSSGSASFPRDIDRKMPTRVCGLAPQKKKASGN